MMEKCQGCCRIDPNMKLKISSCPKCRKNTYMSFLSGNTFVWKCNNCGHRLYLFSLYGNCELNSDVIEYELNLNDISKENMVKFGKRYSISMAELKKGFGNNESIKLKCELCRILEEEEFLKSIGVGCSLKQELQYKKYYTCKERMEIRRKNEVVEVVIGEA